MGMLAFSYCFIKAPRLKLLALPENATKTRSSRDAALPGYSFWVLDCIGFIQVNA